MDEIIAEYSESILRMDLNRPTKRNAMTSSMYVPEFGSSCSVPARIAHVRAAELILLGLPFDAKRAADLGFVTQVVSDQNRLTTATKTARK
jgi:enoyl-CoA hydratase/carnithine racemase